MVTDDDLVQFHASVVGGNHPSTTTGFLKTRANTGSDLAHARETNRENGEQRGVRRGENAGFGWLALARSCPESAPVLAGIGEKKPTDNGWFLEFWWRNSEPNPRPPLDANGNTPALSP